MNPELVGMWKSMYAPLVIAQMEEPPKPGESVPFKPLESVKGDVHIYGYIQSGPDFFSLLFGGGVYTSPNSVLSELGKAGKDVRLLVNSLGGDFHAASAIRFALQEHKKRGGTIKSVVEGMDGSASTIITQTGDTVEMADTGSMMLHSIRRVYRSGTYDAKGLEEKSRQFAEDAKYAREQNRMMARIYADRSGKKPSEFLGMLDRDTFLSAQQAVDKGLANSIFSV